MHTYFKSNKEGDDELLNNLGSVLVSKYLFEFFKVKLCRIKQFKC